MYQFRLTRCKNGCEVLYATILTGGGNTGVLDVSRDGQTSRVIVSTPDLAMQIADLLIEDYGGWEQETNPEGTFGA